jgi:hypothetical protein
MHGEPVTSHRKGCALYVPKSADELAAEGTAMMRAGHIMVSLHPEQEWLAVQAQCAFVRLKPTAGCQ